MEVYYITGTSKGIGKALAEKLLQQGHSVIGIARTCTISHSNYRHYYLDLADTSAVANFTFTETTNCDKIVLINNAGALGEIKYVGNLSAKSIVETYHVNLVSPVILTNTFIETYRNTSAKKIILNISSGAARNEYDGWSLYCSSKSSIDMFSRATLCEQNITNEGFKVLAVAPGIIETDMQKTIRSTNPSQFSMHEKFIESHNAGILKTPTSVAIELVELLNNSENIHEAVIDLRTFQAK